MLSTTDDLSLKKQKQIILKVIKAHKTLTKVANKKYKRVLPTLGHLTLIVKIK